MEKLTVIGSGTMGHSITLSAAWAGINVNMYGLTEILQLVSMPYAKSWRGLLRMTL